MLTELELKKKISGENI